MDILIRKTPQESQKKSIAGIAFFWRPSNEGQILLPFRDVDILSRGLSKMPHSQLAYREYAASSNKATHNLGVLSSTSMEGEL